MRPDTDPIQKFREWFDEAVAAEPKHPNAMTVATVGADGRPHSRIVLLKEIEDDGFVFYTSYLSAKGQDLTATNVAAASFYWRPLDRQIHIEGDVERVSRQQSVNYWKTRPRQSQLCGWASRQSHPIASRDLLEAQLQAIEARFPEEVPLPDFWGGYRLVPNRIEFWQQRPNRFHDRWVFSRQPDDQWMMTRLQP